MAPECWKTVKLNEITLKIGDGLHGTPMYDEQGEYYFINGSNLVNGRIRLNENTKRANEQEFYKYKKELSDRTILIGINGTIGNIALYNNENVILSKSAAYLNVKENFDRDFLKYVLLSDHFQKFIKTNATGTTIKNVGLALLREYEFWAPESLKKQKQIASILSSLDDKIELNLQINKTLESIAQAIFKEWFVDFRFPGFDGELVDGVPKGWRYGILGEIVKNFDSKRIPVSSQERAKRKGIYPYYGAASLMDYIDDYLFDGIYLLMGEDGSVIDDKGYPILQYVWGKFWVNNHAHVLQGSNPFSTEYIYILLKGTSISNIVTGAVQPKINQGNLNSIKCIIPDKRVLQEFNKIVFPIFERIMFNQDENSTIRNIRDTLLPKLMTGKIRVA